MMQGACTWRSFEGEFEPIIEIVPPVNDLFRIVLPPSLDLSDITDSCKTGVLLIIGVRNFFENFSALSSVGYWIKIDIGS